MKFFLCLSCHYQLRFHHHYYYHETPFLRRLSLAKILQIKQHNHPLQNDNKEFNAERKDCKLKNSHIIENSNFRNFVSSRCSKKYPSTYNHFPFGNSNDDQSNRFGSFLQNENHPLSKINDDERLMEKLDDSKKNIKYQHKKFKKMASSEENKTDGEISCEFLSYIRKENENENENISIDQFGSNNVIGAYYFRFNSKCSCYDCSHSSKSTHIFGKKKYTCLLCGLIFSSDINLKKHHKYRKHKPSTQKSFRPKVENEFSVASEDSNSNSSSSSNFFKDSCENNSDSCSKSLNSCKKIYKPKFHSSTETFSKNIKCSESVEQQILSNNRSCENDDTAISIDSERKDSYPDNTFSFANNSNYGYNREYVNANCSRKQKYLLHSFLPDQTKQVKVIDEVNNSIVISRTDLVNEASKFSIIISPQNANTYNFKNARENWAKENIVIRENNKQNKTFKNENEKNHVLGSLVTRDISHPNGPTINSTVMVPEISLVEKHIPDSKNCNKSIIPEIASRPSTLSLDKFIINSKVSEVSHVPHTSTLSSPETPRPNKSYGQMFHNGHAYTYLGLKCSTRMFYCTLNRTQPMYVQHQHGISMYCNWKICEEISTTSKYELSNYDSRNRSSNYTMAGDNYEGIITHSLHRPEKLNKKCKSLILKNNDEKNYYIKDDSDISVDDEKDFLYVRGRGEGKLKCEKCGIRCKKPSMMKKHLKTHTNLRPFSCKQCCFSFKTKGNLTKHEKSKTHFEHRANFNDKFIRPDSFVFNKEFMSSEDSSSKDGDFTAESTCKKPYNDCMKIQEAAKSLLCLADTTMDHTREPTIRPLTYPYDSNIKNESISNDHPNSLNESFIEKNVNSPIDLRIKQKMEVNLNHKSEPAKVHSSESFNQKMIQAYVTECHLLNDKLKGHCKTISVISENFQPDNFNQHETQELTNYNTFYQHDNITDFVENHTLQQPLQEKPDLRNSVIIRSNESDEMLMKDDSSTVISDPIEADNREILYYNKNENVNVNEPSKSENLIHKLNNLTTNPSLLKSSSIQTKSHFLNSVFVILHTLSNAFSQCYFDNFHIKKDSNT
uniref:C2H2-type domain-containing protein n=1 Tax=Trichogramma kaykai TaxID=54128 RepID=A0ABD2X0E5_9HYME